MLKRIIENHQDENFRGMENARKCAKEAEQSSKMRFRGFLKMFSHFSCKTLLFAIRPYDLLYITPIDIRHKKHSRLRGGEKNERK